ncbi:MAG: M15 family metallopeptidase [[Clostridium] innocuum]|nr:M15 family metallopeptidase [[Clostridium] innocuum]
MKRRKRVKRKVKIAAVIVLLICIAVSLIIINRTRIQLAFKGYDRDERNIIMTLSAQEIDEYVSFASDIDISKWNRMKNNKHYLDYELYAENGADKKEAVAYVDQFYADYYQALRSQGFDQPTLRTLMKKTSLADFKTIKDKKLTWKQIQPYIHINGRILEDVPDYLKSGLKPLEAVMRISYASINSSAPITIQRSYSLDDPKHLLLMIKRSFYVPKTYVPENLTAVQIPVAHNDGNNLMRKDAADALESMYKDAKKQGLILAINSAYRPYNEQQQVYDEYMVTYGVQTAVKLVAEPGCSEHQLGLSVDLTSQSVMDGTYAVFGDTPEYQWVIKNAHKYGFILRYPENKTNITGTANEPWHFRYVGTEAATEIYRKNLCLEEYTLQHGFSYPVSIKR